MSGRFFRRIFRVWGKKRGHRHSGSPLLGSMGETLFFGALLVLGTALLATVTASQIMNPTPEIYRPGFGFWLMVLVLASFALIGGWGVVRTLIQLNASVERRSALACRAAGIDIIRDASLSAKDYPTVPRDGDLTNSPGVILAFRLPVVQSSMWMLWFALVFCLVCTGLTSFLLVGVVSTHVRGDPEWFLTLFLVPLVIMDGWAIVVFVREVWQHARIGPTCVEISDHPLRPGHEYDIFLSQAGRLSLHTLEMSLVCQEEATYHQGTDIRKETRVVHEQTVFEYAPQRALRSATAEIRERMRVPSDAMHSFRSAHNALQWKLVLKGLPESGSEFVRSFPVIVYPLGGGSQRHGHMVANAQ